MRSGYEIVVPRKVRSDGKFVSHQIPHHFKRSFYMDRTATDRVPDDAVHYRLQIDDEEHHLELRPNSRLVAPGAVTEEHGVSRITKAGNNEDFLRNVKLRGIHDAQCHYQGRVHGQSGNSALSTCYGLAGYIRTKRSWYTIEPVAGHDFTKETEHPHVVYKKRPDEFGRNAEILCNVTGNMAKTIAKRAFSSQKSHPPKKQAKSYTMELLLVLDKTVLDYRQDFDAAGLLHDDSLGIPVDLSVVRIIRLHVQEDEMNLAITRDPNSTLKYFQEWQQMINPGDDAHPNHHDCAILITKSNICDSPSMCGFTGASTIAGTCDPLKGAAVINDVGLHTGYHIAHHIGHTLGMLHDLEEENGCPGIIRHEKGYIETTVMYPGNMYVTKRWSKCSRNSLNSYIDTGLGFCLEDAQNYKFTNMDLLPGVMYDGDDQCRIEYTPDARQCDLEISCEALRCAIPRKGCVSMRKPPAEGTRCGENRWCYGMKCLLVGERPGVVDGGWGSWSPWSRCSRSCGSGVAFSVRRCINPAPSNGGAYCRGDRKRHKICTTKPCDIGAPSFRDVQCSEFNNWVFPEDGKVHRWTAYNLPEDLRASENPCGLYCLSETDVVATLQPRVVDGTTCYRGIRDICIEGVCREIPCDLNMESNAIEDACGVCRGNGTSCSLKEAMITIGPASQPRKVVDVPVGATNIRLEEIEPSKSRIMVQTTDGKSLIDGDRLGMFELAGTRAWLGRIRASQEALSMPGPVTEDLVILVLPKENVTVRYSFGVKEKSPRKPEFSWDFVDWERCSANCGPGEQISKPRCLEKLAGIVDETYCKNIMRPEEKVKPCYRAPCLPRWMIGDWQGCTSCVVGCEKKRTVKCVRPVGHSEQDIDIIADSYCQGPKPKEQESCTGREKRDNVVTQDQKNKSDEYSSKSSSKTRRKYKEKAKEAYSVKRGELVVDTEDIKNLTLTIILERDEANDSLNFPKDFEPQPPSNSTEFTLVGMDAVKYIQKIEQDVEAASKRHLR
ncbi:PREDICTED: A disintegrin and metalloproteinase with thrombospondin motifs 7-like [Eufriesea mexicana]|uniref:A disintegrin and metalloproteinase with thrombospondin motifs 7-like n=1 Tax=Eufriesea mexicana TaxID=516756 RepID=UPI00083C19BE|nr:PREDICTED: A disintegrin and metalloproteinase with thrombospondin motifs 7-like [Eufriesea mexicana]